MTDIIDQIKQQIKQNSVVQELFAARDVDLDLLDLMPMFFGPFEVSARTEKGIICFNEELRDDPDELDHYMVHELTHVLDQCFGPKPTKGSNDGNYLDNPYEQKAFQAQTEYISETDGDDEAESYISDVLDHHDVPQKDRKKRKEQLLELAAEVTKLKK
jgi:hypothetical protein